MVAGREGEEDDDQMEDGEVAVARHEDGQSDGTDGKKLIGKKDVKDGKGGEKDAMEEDVGDEHIDAEAAAANPEGLGELLGDE